MTNGSGSGASGGGTGGGRTPFPEVIDGRYRVRRLLGKGGQGAVYLAYDPNLDIDVAIKILEGDVHSDEFKKRLRDEARLVARLSHPNIVQVRDYDSAFPYLVMEYCDGGDLTTLLKRRPMMTVHELLGIARQIAAALATAHQSTPPIMHRDLKPGNILFHRGIPKVGDFGLAKMMGVQTGVTTTRGMMGTIRYTSPEQSLDISRTDHRTDLWALGVILYEMLTWIRPFDRPGDDFVQVAVRVRTEEPRTPPFPLPEPIAEVIRVALRKRPEERFATAREMGAAIDAALAAIPDADRTYLPPLERRTELDQIASLCADHVEQGDEGQARQLLARMRELAPDDSLTRFWSKRSSDALGSRPSTAGSAAASATFHPMGGDHKTEERVKSLIRAGDFREARSRIGEILARDRTNSDAIRLLREIEDAEREHREEINEAYAQAERARTAGDSQAVLRIWRTLAEKYPDSQGVKAELAIAEVQVQEESRARAKGRTERDAAAKVATGDFPGALAIWNAYLAEYPEDAAAAAERRRLETEFEKREAERLRAEAQARVEERRAAGDDAGELAALRDYLAAAPFDASARARTAELALALQAARRAEEHARTRQAASAFATRQRYGEALAAWRRHLSVWPGDEDARAEALKVEELVAREEGQAAAAMLEDLVARVSRRLGGGRYRSLPEHERIVATLLERAGGAGLESGPVLAALNDELKAAFAAAESRLAVALAAQIAPLSESARAARRALEGRLPSTDAVEAARDRLAGALAGAMEALAAAHGGDPLATLADADRRIAEALAVHGEACRAAEEEERHRLRQQADEVRDLVRRAQELVACADPDGSADASEALGEAVRQALAGNGSPRQSARELSSVRARAEALQFLAGARLSAHVREQAIEAVIEAMERGDGALLERAQKALQTRLSADLLQPTLAAELARAARLLQEQRQAAPAAPTLPGDEETRWRRARERWDATGPAPDPELESEARAAIGSGDQALGRSDAGGMSRAAERLEAAVRRKEWAVISERHAAVLAGLDGNRFSGAASWEADLRRALAAGDAARIEKLAGSPPKGRVASPASQGLRPRAVDARTRAHNARVQPRALERYDRLLKEDVGGEGACELVRAREALIEPPPRWPWWTAAAGATGAALIVLIALATGDGGEPSRPGSFPVVFATLGRAVEITSLTTSDGRPVEGAPAAIEDGATLSLAEGHYRLERKGENEIRFQVPESGTVVLGPPPAGSLESAIDSALEPSAVASTGAGR